MLRVLDGRGGGVTDTFGGGGGGRAVGFTVLHIGGCDVISHGGLGLLVVVVVAATNSKSYYNIRLSCSLLF